MDIYSFKNIKNVYVTGDCHGELKTFFNGIKRHLVIHEEDNEIHPMEIERAERAARFAVEVAGRRINATRNYFNEFYDKKCSNGALSRSVIIVAGDCGFGFNKPKYYTTILEKYNKIFSYNNTHVIFIRGNHDDPQYFDGKTINFSHIKAVPDYSLIEVNDKGILCVGGAISVDRVWRKEHENRVNRFSKANKKTFYWPNEAPVFNIDAINEITKEHKINYVVSHTCPSFTSIEKHEGFDEWRKKDDKLKEDIANERLVMDKIYEALRDSGNRPIYWAYGHFDENFVEKRSDTIFRALPDGFNPISVEDDIKQFIFNEEIKKKNDKSSRYDSTFSIKHREEMPFNIGALRQLDMMPAPEEQIPAPEGHINFDDFDEIDIREDVPVAGVEYAEPIAGQF